MKSIIGTISFAVCIFVASVCFANWGGSANFGTFGGGHLEALGSKYVELLDENLKIDLYKDHALVTVEYAFRNTGNDVTVKAGFPNINFHKQNEIHDYGIEVDGEKIPFKATKGKETKYVKIPGNLTVMDEDQDGPGKLKLSWFVSEVQFRQGSERKIKITYSSRYQMSVGGVSDDSDYDAETFRYLLSTGGTWKGPIKKGTVIINAISVDPDSINIAPPGRFRRTDNSFMWNFQDLKPTRKDDIAINFNNPVSIKMVYGPEETFGKAYYVVDDKKKKYYYVSRDFSVQASATLDNAKRYSAENIKDMKLSTAWCVKHNAGDKEYLLLKLNKPATITQIGIIPGYAKSREVYNNNNRITQITAIVNDTFTVTSSVPDEYVSYDHLHPKAYHYIDLQAFGKPVKTIKLIIDKIVSGLKEPDTCVSEVILQERLKNKPNAGAR